jgi:hypothetical protein
MFEIRFFTTCKWCSKKFGSSVENYQQLYCFSICEQYHMLYIMIRRLLDVANVNTSKMSVHKEWNHFFNFIFETNLFIYNHRRDDIGFDIGSLYVLRNLSMENNFEGITNSIVCQHLENLVYFLNTTRK